MRREWYILIDKDVKRELVSFNNEYLVSDEILPVRKHQAYEDLLKLEKEFASLIYIQRIQERRDF